MKKFHLPLNLKKTLVTVSFAAGLFLIAGQAMAAAYVTGTKNASTTASTTVSQFASPEQAAAYQQAQVSQQPQAYPMMGSFGPYGNNLGYYSGQSAFTQIPYSAAYVPVTLMHVITTALVWVVLIQLILLLAKLLKKHNQ